VCIYCMHAARAGQARVRRQLYSRSLYIHTLIYMYTSICIHVYVYIYTYIYRQTLISTPKSAPIYTLFIYLPYNIFHTYKRHLYLFTYTWRKCKGDRPPVDPYFDTNTHANIYTFHISYTICFTSTTHFCIYSHRSHRALNIRPAPGKS